MRSEAEPHEPGCLGNHLGDCAVSGLFEIKAGPLANTPDLVHELDQLRTRLELMTADRDGWIKANNVIQTKRLAAEARANLAETKLAAIETLLLHPPAGASEAELLAGARGWLRMARESHAYDAERARDDFREAEQHP